MTDAIRCRKHHFLAIRFFGIRFNEINTLGESI
jgi:hypothetical protein